MQSILIQAALLLLALLVLALPALAHKRHWQVIREDWRQPLRIFLGVWSEELGASVTYLYPTGNNSTTPPTASEAAHTPIQTAQFFIADADTSVTITHNWGQLLQVITQGSSYPFFQFPIVALHKILGGAADASFATNFTWNLTNTNSITLNKGAGAQGGTYNIYLRLPHSISG